MACLAGTVEGYGSERYESRGPRRWTRYYPDGRLEEGDGRPCKRTAPWATAKTCSSCFLFRGTDSWGQEHIGLDVNDEPTVLSMNEREQYEAAQAAAFDDDDFLPMDRFVRRMRGEVWGVKYLALQGDPDALIEQAARMRAYRERHPEVRERQNAARKANRLANMERERVAARARMAKWRLRRQYTPIEENKLTRKYGGTDDDPTTRQDLASQAGARARDGGVPSA